MNTDQVSTETTARSRGDVLFVTYHFPPIRSAGIFRVIGMARCLRDEGWRVHILTVRHSRFDVNDPDTLALVPSGIGITRTKTNDTLAPLFGTPNPTPESSAPAGGSSSASVGRSRGVQLMRRVLRPARRLVASILGFPDRRVGWVGPLASAVLRHLNEHPGAVVFSTSPPHSSHIALAALKKIKRFPWVADFRDPWTVPPRTRSTFFLGLHRIVESVVLRGVDHVVANTEGNRGALLEQFRFLAPDRVTTVPNAYDPYHDRAHSKMELHPSDLMYLGEVYPGLLDRYLDAIEWIKRSGKTIPTLDIYGEMSQQDRDGISSRGLSDHVRYRGTLSYPDSLAAMKEANALLLLLREEPGWRTWVPSKLYSYMFSGRPTLALAPDGDATEIIKRTNTGRVVALGSAESVAQGIRAFLTEIANTTIPPNTEALNEYRIEATSRRVSTILESVQK